MKQRAKPATSNHTYLRDDTLGLCTVVPGLGWAWTALFPPLFPTRRLLVVLAGLLCAGAVSAEVELRTSVDRIAKVTARDGQTETLLLDATRVHPGEELRYKIEFTNTSREAVGSGIIIITNPVPETVEYLEGTAAGRNTEILFSVDEGTNFALPEALTIMKGGAEVLAAAEQYTTIRWVYRRILFPGESSFVSFDVRLKE